MVLRILTAGESHGPALVGILEGFPAQVPLDLADLNHDLRRRQRGFGRSGRQEIEQDQLEFLGGLRGGLTLGSPLAFLIRNRDYPNWEALMDPHRPPQGVRVTAARPGHADLSGALKYGFADLRPVMERASARETAVRAAAGSICAQFLRLFGIEAQSHVLAVGGIWLEEEYTYEDLSRAEKSPLRCLDPQAEALMLGAIKEAQALGDSLGGVFEIMIRGVPPGLGNYVHWDRKLDARLAYALMSIQGLKGVEIGAGFAAAAKKGSQCQDPIHYSPKRGFYRSSNRAGGLEGGMSTGEDLVLRGAMKPLPTLQNPLATVDLISKKPCLAPVERSDICAVPAASVVGELVALTVVAEAFLEVYGADSLERIQSRWKNLQ